MNLDKIIKIQLNNTLQSSSFSNLGRHYKGKVRDNYYLDDKIIMIDISSPTTAMAKVECNILKNHYTDYLSLIKVSGKWGIISKVFHMSPGN